MGKSIQALIHVHSLIIRINPFICDNREREREREREKEKETDRQSVRQTEKDRVSTINHSHAITENFINDYEAASINCQHRTSSPYEFLCLVLSHIHTWNPF